MKYYIFQCGHEKVERDPVKRKNGHVYCPVCGEHRLRAIEITCIDCGKVFEVRPKQSRRDRCFDCKYKTTLKNNLDWKGRNSSKQKIKPSKPERCTCCGIRPKAPGNHYLCYLCYAGGHGTSSEGWEIGGYGEHRVLGDSGVGSL